MFTCYLFKGRSQEASKDASQPASYCLQHVCWLPDIWRSRAHTQSHVHTHIHGISYFPNMYIFVSAGNRIGCHSYVEAEHRNSSRHESIWKTVISQISTPRNGLDTRHGNKQTDEPVGCNCYLSVRFLNEVQVFVIRQNMNNFGLHRSNT